MVPVHKMVYQVARGEVEPDLSLTELDDDSWAPTCTRCGKVASPFVDTTAGAVCFRCFDGGGDDHPTPTLAGAMALLDRTHWRLIAYRLAECLTLDRLLVMAEAAADAETEADEAPMVGAW